MSHSHIPAWDSNNALSLQAPLHELPRKAVDIFPKFDGDGNASTTEHIRKYESIICLLNVVYEDIVCMLFPLTFEGKVFNWFNVSHIHSIHNLLQFKKFFTINYNPINSYKDLSEMQVNDGESIDNFNIHFRLVFFS